nr:MAG TPA: hypothetical protein [Caudoviricetes sp.]
MEASPNSSNTIRIPLQPHPNPVWSGAPSFDTHHTHHAHAPHRKPCRARTYIGIIG